MSLNSSFSEQRFEEAFKENLHKVRYYAQSYLKDKELAENIAQDAFMQLWKNRDNVNFNESVLPYLLFIARNLALNVIRKGKYKASYEDYTIRQSKELLNFEALKDFSSSSLYYKEIENLLKIGMERMPNQVRETFSLSRIDGLSHRDIMNAQNISMKTVESRITVALKLLKEVFKDYLMLFIGFY